MASVFVPSDPAPPPDHVMRVSSESPTGAVAGAIAKSVRTNGVAHLSCIGARAVSQAVKAIAVARRYVEDSGLDLVCAPSFHNIEIDGDERTTLRFRIESRPL